MNNVPIDVSFNSVLNLNINNLLTSHETVTWVALDEPVTDNVQLTRNGK